MTNVPQEMHVQNDEVNKAENSSSDDDSSSSSSGSSSSSSSSDSESEDDAEAESTEIDANSTKHLIPFGNTENVGNSSTASTSSLSAPRPHGLAANQETLNVNSTRAAARFKAAETEFMMPLGTRKRDRRTIEEIQRDLRDKRKKPMGKIAAKMSPPPPKGSPLRSPEAEAMVSSGAPMAVGGSLNSFGTAGRLPVKRKPVSAHDRLAMKLNGRKTTSAKAKKASSSTTPSATAPPVAVMTNKIVTKAIAASSSTNAATGNSSSSDHGDVGGDGYSSSVGRSSAVAIDGKVVRAMLRAMLRYGDMTDVGLYAAAINFADEYKMPNFIERANLQSTTKVSFERLQSLANEVALKAKQAIETRPPHDGIKIADVEAKASQIIERLYENLKLRVAVQRALRTAGCSSGNAQVNAQGAYVLVAKQSDLSVLGVNTRDLPSWTWAEKEHDWTQRKDAALLLGVYVHGFGGWEDILNDDLLHFQKQRALKGERLKKRAENLLKRLSAPDMDAGEPRIVQQASALSSASVNSNQSLGAQFSAIIQSGAISGVTASNSVHSGTGGGRMARAAERFAARQQSSEEMSSRRPAIPCSDGTTSNGDSGRQKTPPVRSPAQNMVADIDPEEGEIGDASPAQSTSSQHKRRSSSLEDGDMTTTRKKHRHNSSDSLSVTEKPKKELRKETKKQKGHKSPISVANVVADEAPEPALPLLSAEECNEKWKPNKKLRDIRQVLKKIKIMAEWSSNQKDETVAEKMFKYVSTIGEAIDRIVMEHQDKVETQSHGSPRESDELCTSLWTYAAGFTTFTPQSFEQLYDDICADGDALKVKKSF
ncbi:Domain of unknown function DUF4208 [Plasmopara halstedii]|uniref:Chromodomain-helicase-DNA-binding protein 1-like C-terminal domain-containing protein n=1 Tax=Plasmopara halstedii TaxID=4781 RepID=A0A0P1AZZ7_PLAHL|nr:Domain of unknown function DUF4208 [Plasmopara halstedii]CEG48047.1 Domain of unknown function DUF4208 [Plasmopara halstedii]|eukprot:XP_024584416.1 Domain of unknown function DUF4208 [Plasmopara halstedii]